MRFFPIFSAMAALAVLSVACGSQVASRPQAEAFEVELRAESDDGVPLAGTAWSTNGLPLGETGADGALRLTLRGREGQSMQTAVACPTGYAVPDAIPELRLTHARRLSDKKAQPVAVEVMCTRSAREVALIVHTEHGAALPLLVNGKAAGTTDADGNAHVLLRVDRSVRKLDVTVDTSARTDLTPKNPARSFELDGRDGVLLFAENFTVSVTAKARAQARPKYVPYRVD